MRPLPRQKAAFSKKTSPQPKTLAGVNSLLAGKVHGTDARPMLEVAALQEPAACGERFGVRRQSAATTALWCGARSVGNSKAASRFACRRTPEACAVSPAHGPERVQFWRLALSKNQKVGRAVLCAPPTATTLSCRSNDGAHGVTRPTSANRFMAPMRVQCWRLKLSTRLLCKFAFFATAGRLPCPGVK